MVEMKAKGIEFKWTAEDEATLNEYLETGTIKVNSLDLIMYAWELVDRKHLREARVLMNEYASNLGCCDFCELAKQAENEVGNTSSIAELWEKIKDTDPNDQFAWNKGE